MQSIINYVTDTKDTTDTTDLMLKYNNLHYIKY